MARSSPSMRARPGHLSARGRTGSRSSRVAQPALRVRARFPLPGFPTCMRVSAEYVQEPSGKSSFPELPFELVYFFVSEKTPRTRPESFVFERTDTYAPKFF